ncbi:MAG: pantoate--beta-alanine ligase [bacterium]
MSEKPPLLTTIEECRAWSRNTRQSGSLGFVPTMGALHQGHAQLMIEAGQQCNHVAASIYVNPTQFGPNEDLARYPRTLDADLDLCASVGVKAVFFPTDLMMYPNGRNHFTAVEVPGLTTIFEGASRPGHFTGVATVVTKLFGIMQPDIAFFGQKDFQQWLVIRRMTADLNLPVALRRVDTVREADGLAMSSRNRYLTTDQRATALALSRALFAAKSAVEQGERLVKNLELLMISTLTATPGLELDYARIVDADNLGAIEKIDPAKPESAVALVAARVGTTRLIDNILLA